MAATVNKIDARALLAELESVPLVTNGGGGHTCQTGHALSALPDDVRPAVDALIDRDDLNAVAVADVLNSHGIAVQAANLRRHRKRGTAAGCRCPKGAAS